MTDTPVTTRSLTDDIALDRIGRMLGARTLDDLNMLGAVVVEQIEGHIDFLGPDGALTVARHAGSASRVRDLELADLRADRLAVA